jgi:hypothetical protein
MKTKTKTILSLLIFTILCAFTGKTDLDALQFLEGTWKIENKENYETWKKAGDTTLEGNAYKIKAENKVISEYLKIKSVGDQIIYSATVLNQNGVKPIDFVLNKVVKNKFSFENLQHDFPKKIQYTLINKTTLFVEVLGDGDKGFSYQMIKQNN